MRTVDAAVLTTLMQARTFIDSHLHQLGDLESAGYRQKLTDAITALERYSVEQATADRMNDAYLARQRALIAALRRNHMRPIAAIAAARVHDIPELDAFRMPGHRVPATELVIAAEAMAKVARRYAPVFIASGLAPEFVEQLERAAESLRQCVTDRETSGTMKAAATAALRLEASHGRKVLRVLSALIEPRLENDQATLTAWRTSRHIRSAPSRQPVVLPLMGLALTSEGAAGASTASADASTRELPRTAVQMALPPASVSEPVFSYPASSPSSAFSRAAQIIAGDGTVEDPIS